MVGAHEESLETPIATKLEHPKGSYLMQSQTFPHVHPINLVLFLQSSNIITKERCPQK